MNRIESNATRENDIAMDSTTGTRKTKAFWEHASASQSRGGT